MQKLKWVSLVAILVLLTGVIGVADADSNVPEHVYGAKEAVGEFSTLEVDVVLLNADKALTNVYGGWRNTTGFPVENLEIRIGNADTYQTVAVDAISLQVITSTVSSDSVGKYATLQLDPPLPAGETLWFSVASVVTGNVAFQEESSVSLNTHIVPNILVEEFRLGVVYPTGAANATMFPAPDFHNGDYNVFLWFRNNLAPDWELDSQMNYTELSFVYLPMINR